MLKLIVLSWLVVLVVTVPTPTDFSSPEEKQSFRRYLEKSKTDDGYSLAERTLLNPKGSSWENSGKFEGDIVLTERQIDSLVNGGAAQRSAALYSAWPDKTVVYEFGDGEFDDEQQAAILEVMDEIEKKTCVRFRKRNDGDRNFVRITGKSDGCYAHVGLYDGLGAHTLNLARERPGRGCLWRAVIIHELFHTLGFHHMQSTHNRDDYVRILWENVMPGAENNFNSYDGNTVTNLGLPYEYTSILHYTDTAFSANGKPTIEAKREFEGIMGRSYGTRLDWLRINRHYNCPGAWSEDSNNVNSDDTGSEQEQPEFAEEQ